MNRWNPRKSSVRKKLRELRQKGTIVSNHPESIGLVAVRSDEFDSENPGGRRRSRTSGTPGGRSRR